MISRRNIRVKVMQTLYAVESQDEAVNKGEPLKLLNKNFDLTRQLLVYLIHYLTEVARYAETDSRNRASKQLPSAEDLNVNTKIAGNEIIWKIFESAGWKLAVKESKPQQIDAGELVRKTYLELADKDEYKKYIAIAGRERKEEKEILEFIF